MLCFVIVVVLKPGTAQEHLKLVSTNHLRLSICVELYD